MIIAGFTSCPSLIHLHQYSNKLVSHNQLFSFWVEVALTIQMILNCLPRLNLMSLQEMMTTLTAKTNITIILFSQLAAKVFDEAVAH